MCTKLADLRQKTVLELYSRHHCWLVKYLTGYLHNQADAEDICQQLFLRLCEQPQQLTAIYNSRAWLVTLARRLCIDQWRKEACACNASNVMAQQAELTAPPPEQQLSHWQHLDSIAMQLQAMPGKTAAIFIDHRLNALTGQQLAQRYQVSLRTVRQRVNVATQRLAASVALLSGTA